MDDEWSIKMIVSDIMYLHPEISYADAIDAGARFLASLDDSADYEDFLDEDWE